MWPELAVEADDISAEKRASSAFFPGFSDLLEQLAKRGIETVIITGTVTNVCYEASARDAATLGDRVIFAADGNAAGSDEVHNVTLHTIYRSFGDVRATLEILEMLRNRVIIGESISSDR